MTDDFDLGGFALDPWTSANDKDKVYFFGKPYAWRRDDGRLTLQPLAAGPVTLGKWDCCGRLRIL